MKMDNDTIFFFFLKTFAHKIQVVTSGNWTLQLLDCPCVELCSERIPTFKLEV